MLAVLVVSALAMPVACAAYQPTLKLGLPLSESVGQPIEVTANGTSEGTLRLFLYADEQRRPCSATPSLEVHGSWELTPYGGEPLLEGEFTRSYSYTPQVQIAELCAYLDGSVGATPAVIARTPDPVQEYLENETEAQPIETRSGELPGALKPQPVNEQIEREYWARVQREEHEHAQVRTAVPVCVVPRLRGHSLAGARRALTAAGCALGHIRRRRRHGRLVVVAQGTPAGRALEGGAAVAVVLGPPRR